MDAPLFNWNKFLGDLRVDFAQHTTSYTLPENHSFPLRNDSVLKVVSFEITSGEDIVTESDKESETVFVPAIQPLPNRKLREINIKLETILAKVNDLVPMLESSPQTKADMERIFQCVRDEHAYIEQYTHLFRSSPILRALQTEGIYTVEAVKEALDDPELENEVAENYLKTIRRYTEINYLHRSMLITCTKISQKIHQVLGKNDKFVRLCNFRRSVPLVPVKDEIQTVFRKLGKLRARIEHEEKRNKWAFNNPRVRVIENPYRALAILPKEVLLDLIKQISTISSQHPQFVKIGAEFTFFLSKMAKYVRFLGWDRSELFQELLFPLVRDLRLKLDLDLVKLFLTHLPKDKLQDFIRCKGLTGDFSVKEQNPEEKPVFPYTPAKLVILLTYLGQDFTETEEPEFINFLMSVYIELTTRSPFNEKWEHEQSEGMACALLLLKATLTKHLKTPDLWPAKLRQLGQKVSLKFFNNTIENPVDKTLTFAQFLAICLKSPVLYRWMFKGEKPLLEKMEQDCSIIIDLSKFEMTQEQFADLVVFNQEGIRNLSFPQAVSIARLMDFFGIKVDENVKDLYAFLPELTHNSYFKSNELTRLDCTRLLEKYFKKIEDKDLLSEEKIFNLYLDFRKGIEIINKIMENREKAKEENEYVEIDYRWKFAFSSIHLMPHFIRTLNSYLASGQLDQEEYQEAMNEIQIFYSLIEFDVKMDMEKIHHFYNTAAEIHRLVPIKETMVKIRKMVASKLEKFDERVRNQGSLQWFNEIAELTSYLQIFNDADWDKDIEIRCLKTFLWGINLLEKADAEQAYQLYREGLRFLDKLRPSPDFMPELNGQVIPIQYLNDVVVDNILFNDFEERMRPIVYTLNRLYGYYKSKGNDQKGIDFDFTKRLEERESPLVEQLRLLSQLPVRSLTLYGGLTNGIYTWSQRTEIEKLFKGAKIIWK